MSEIDSFPSGKTEAEIAQQLERVSGNLIARAMDDPDYVSEPEKWLDDVPGNVSGTYHSNEYPPGGVYPPSPSRDAFSLHDNGASESNGAVITEVSQTGTTDESGEREIKTQVRKYAGTHIEYDDLMVNVDGDRVEGLLIKSRRDGVDKTEVRPEVAGPAAVKIISELRDKSSKHRRDVKEARVKAITRGNISKLLDA